MIDLVQYRRSRGNTEGVGWAIVAAAMLTLMTFAVRQSTRELHVLQVVFVRNALALLLMAPWMPSTELRSVTTRIRPFLPRAICEAATITLWFSALSLVPLTEAVALSFSLPLFATLAARLFLGETVGWKRWLAVSAGFAGVLLVLQPGRQSFAPTALLVLLSSATAAVAAPNDGGPRISVAVHAEGRCGHHSSWWAIR